MGQGESRPNVPAVKLSPEEEEKMLVKRKEILNEILETERAYVRTLDITVRLWLMPLRAKKIIKEKDIVSIFSIIETILSFHQKFFSELQARMHPGWTAKLTIGDIFTTNTEFMKIYKDYVNNFNNCMETTSKCTRKYSAFQSFLAATQLNPECENKDLMSFLISPVQRLPRYQLLLQDLVKNTPPTFKDYGNLVSALEKVKGVAEYINEEKRISENIQKLLQIQASISSNVNLVESHRIFIQEGDLKQITKSNKIIDLHYLLFNDLILFVLPEGSFLTLHTVKWKLIDNAPLLSVDMQDVPDIKTNKFCVEIRTPKQTIPICFSSEKEKESWIKDFYWHRSKVSTILAKREEEAKEAKRKKEAEKKQKEKEEKKKGTKKVDTQKEEKEKKEKQKQKEKEKSKKESEKVPLLGKKKKEEEEEKTCGCFG